MSAADSRKAGDERWTRAVALDELWEGELTALRLGATEVLLVRCGERSVVAYENRCPHAGARLSEGRLLRATLRCAAHHWEFDVHTGAGINPRNCRLRQYAVKVVDGEVLLRLTE